MILLYTYSMNNDWQNTTGTSDGGSDWIPMGPHRYRGQVENGVPHGTGEMKRQDCSVYYGRWEHGEMQGYGTMTWPSGKRYEGEWDASQPSGQGRMEYPNGSVYKGEFRQGLRQGHGVLQQPDGGYWEGMFVDDRITDDAVFVNAKGQRNDVRTLRKKAEPSAIAKFWDKTWQLWVAIACFGFAVLTAVWVFDFFSGRGSSHMRTKGIVAPILLVIAGFKFLIGFFSDLGNKN